MLKKIKIYNQQIYYNVCYRPVTYPRLEFKTGSLVLILPENTKNEKEIIERHKNWIYEKNKLIKNALKDLKNHQINSKRTEIQLKKFVNYLSNKFSDNLKININKIFYRKMKSKWGSLSSKKNLTLNTMVKYLPDYLIKYIIYHEIAHLFEKKHNQRFWKIINKKYKNYSRYESSLLKYWFLIQKKTTSLV